MKKITRLSFLLVLCSCFIFSACNNAGGEKKKTKKMASLVEQTLRSPDYPMFLKQMYGNKPNTFFSNAA